VRKASARCILVASSLLTGCGHATTSAAGTGGSGGGTGDTGSAGSATASVDAGDGAAEAGTGPIALADEWVAGWYGTAYRGENRYDHVSSPGAPNGYYTAWRGDPGVTLFANVTDCSSFSDVLLSRLYGWTPPTTNPRPLAADYYWAVRGTDHFTPVTTVGDIRVGDVIALLYGTTDSSGDTGHVAWVDALPSPSTGGPVETGLSQLTVTVIDSADGFHFAEPDDPLQDDRYLGPIAGGAPCATDTQCVTLFGPYAVCDDWQLDGGVGACAFTGVGRGQMRLYADATGAVAGYAWGTSPGSTFYGRPSPLPAMGAGFTGRDIVVGRYTASP
jgi:hypothetical protein